MWGAALEMSGLDPLNSFDPIGGQPEGRGAEFSITRRFYSRTAVEIEAPADIRIGLGKLLISDRQ